jgi:hypothetical protein
MKSLWVKVGVILVVGLAIFGYAEVWGADWKYMGYTDFGVYYYDAENIIRPSENIVRVWTKIIYSEAGVNQWVKDSGKRYRNLDYSITLFEYNCPDKMFKGLSVTLYSKDGNIITDFTADNPKRAFIRPETFEEVMFNAVCK